MVVYLHRLKVATIVVMYSLILEVLIYREMTVKKFISILKETVRDSITIALIIAGATFFGYVATRVRIPQLILREMTSLVSDRFMLLVIINIFLLIIVASLKRHLQSLLSSL